MTVALALCSALVVMSAVWVVTLQNLFRAALSLGLVLVGLAAVFILLQAEFLAFVLILIYVGAILTLVIFAIMLTAKHQAPSAVVPSAHRQSIPAMLASLAFFLMLVSTTSSLRTLEILPQPPDLQTLGQQLVTTLVLPFEVISLVLVVALVGAIALAKPSTAISAPAVGSQPSLPMAGHLRPDG